jgi:uncharacterized membrane protein
LFVCIFIIIFLIIINEEQRFQSFKLEFNNTFDRFMHYAASRMVSGSIPDEDIELFSVYEILPTALYPCGSQSL